MKKRSTIKIATYFNILIIGMHTGINCALASPVNINGTFHWRSIRGPNTVNYRTGDTLILGAGISPVEGTTAKACQSGVCYNLFFVGDATFPNEFSIAIQYNPALTGKWAITAINGQDVDVSETNAVSAVGPMPFVRNTRISGTGLTPTIKWDLPGDSTEPFNTVYVGIFDDITNKRIHYSSPLDVSTRSYTIPDNVLQWTGRYVFRVVPGYEQDGKYINQSITFINFRPLPEGGPDKVYFPVIENGVFKFDFDVEKDVPVFIDPEVAIGYEYVMGVEDTVKFASVTLPEVGDNLFDLYLFDGSTFYLAEENIASGQIYVFDSQGVDKFKILGIEKNAQLYPNDVTAFITELTFTGTGQFTGSMAPIITSVPMPTNLVSTFDTGHEGWMISGDGTNFIWHASGGNPGGFISGEDQMLGTNWSVMSPYTWAGDWTSYLGGIISFDLKLISGDTNRYYSSWDVIIGTEDTWRYAKWSSGIDPELGTWTHYEVRISESNFEIVGNRTWNEILSNVTYLLIRGEHIGGPDTEGIDNIRVVDRLGLLSISPILQMLLLDNK